MRRVVDENCHKVKLIIEPWIIATLDPLFPLHMIDRNATFVKAFVVTFSLMFVQLVNVYENLYVHLSLGFLFGFVQFNADDENFYKMKLLVSN